MKKKFTEEFRSISAYDLIPNTPAKSNVRMSSGRNVPLKKKGKVMTKRHSLIKGNSAHDFDNLFLKKKTKQLNKKQRTSSKKMISLGKLFANGVDSSEDGHKYQTPLEELMGVIETEESFFEQFFLGDMIAKNDNYETWKAKHKKTSEILSVKKIPILLENYEHIKSIVKEIKALEAVQDHPNIVDYYGSYLENEEVYIVLEYCEEGPLNEIYIAMRNPLKEKQAVYIIHEILKALEFIHSKGVMHRDIKCANIMITKNGQVKLTNFSKSAVVKKAQDNQILKRSSFVGSHYWMAPEVIHNSTGIKLYDEKADIWSLGITAIECTQCDPPLAEFHPMHAASIISKAPPPTLAETVDGWSRYFVDFVAKCVQKDQSTRPSATELLDHFIFDRLDPQALDFITRKEEENIWEDWSWEEDCLLDLDEESSDELDYLSHRKSFNSAKEVRRSTYLEKRKAFSKRKSEVGKMMMTKRVRDTVSEEFSPPMKHSKSIKINQNRKKKKKHSEKWKGNIAQAESNLGYFSSEGRDKIHRQHQSVKKNLIRKQHKEITEFEKEHKILMKQLGKTMKENISSASQNINRQISQLQQTLDKEMNKLKKSSKNSASRQKKFQKEIWNTYSEFIAKKKALSVAEKRTINDIKIATLQEECSAQIGFLLRSQKLLSRNADALKNLVTKQVAALESHYDEDQSSHGEIEHISSELKHQLEEFLSSVDENMEREIFKNNDDLFKVKQHYEREILTVMYSGKEDIVIMNYEIEVEKGLQKSKIFETEYETDDLLEARKDLKITKIKKSLKLRERKLDEEKINHSHYLTDLEDSRT